MERIRTAAAGETIGRAMGLVPERIREMVGVDHFEGCPRFAGLVPGFTTEEWRQRNGDPYGTAFATRAMYIAMNGTGPWAVPADRRTPTLAYMSPGWLRPSIVLHEFGHALHRVVRDIDWDAQPLIARVFTDHGNDSYHESFAEAFAAWLLPVELMHLSGKARDRRFVGAARRFYTTKRNIDNRGWLGLFNGLAGWPVDRRPPATVGCWA